MGASQPRQASFATDAARQVTNSLDALNKANIQKVWVYKASASTGLPDSGDFTSCATCVKFTWDTATSALKVTSNNWANTAQNACQGDANRSLLGVYVEYRHESLTRIILNNRVLGESTVMWLEPTTAPVCKP
jgi:hypothetical protein